MIDTLLKPTVTPLFDSWAGRVVESGLSANKLILIGFVFGLAGCMLVAMQQYAPGLVLLLTGRFLDGLAGAVGRLTGTTLLGSYLDLVCDFLIYGAFAFLFSLSVTNASLATAFLLLSYMMMAVCYLSGYFLSGQKESLQVQRGGLVENGEIILFMAVCCMFPPLFPALAPLFALLCWTTAIMRFAKTIRLLKQE